MSIQNRMLSIYTVIFSVAFIAFALIVYVLPRDRILDQIDADLSAVANEITSPSAVVPEDLMSFETASTLVVVANENGRVVARSANLAPSIGLLDPNTDYTASNYTLMRHDDTLLRVLTVPLHGYEDPTGEGLLYFLQVGRLLDTYENFTRVLATALLMGLAAATASMFLAVFFTPRLFRPLEDIATVSRQITRADDLSRRVPHANRPDEIGELARAFNQTLERLERLFRTQQRLLADVSHELRTPLTAVRGNIDLMRRMGEGDPMSLDIIEDEVNRMTRLVGDLLLLARADSGGLPLDRKPLALDDLLVDVYRHALVTDPPVDVELVEVDQVLVMGDSDRLKQLFLNLVDNAIKYTPPGGKVSLSLAKKSGWAHFQVSDTGVGIPAENLPHVFERFYRVDKSRTRAQGGSGLGLSIAKWITQAHGGAIRVESEMGVGTTFTVTLPIYTPATPISAEIEPDDSKEKTRPSLRAIGASLRR